MISYEIKGNIYYKNNKITTKKNIEKELNYHQFYKLTKTGKCNIRDTIKSRKNIEDLRVNLNINTNITDNVINTNKALKSHKNKTLPDHIKSKYKVEIHTYPKLGLKYELWKLNNKYGYLNFISYIKDDNEETINKAIIEDINNQKINK